MTAPRAPRPGVTPPWFVFVMGAAVGVVVAYLAPVCGG